MKRTARVSRKVVMHSKLKNLIRLKRDITVTYVYDKGVRIRQVLNPNFTKDRNGKVRSILDIIKDLEAISHDKYANTFYI